MNAYSYNKNTVAKMDRQDLRDIVNLLNMVVDDSIYTKEATVMLSRNGFDLLGDLKESALALRTELLRLLSNPLSWCEL